MKLLPTITTKTKRIAGTFFLLGITFTVSMTAYVLPSLEAKYVAFTEKVNPATTYTAPYQTGTTTTAATEPETLERYYQEEYAKLEAKYLQELKNAARSNAIDRVQADLEAEKEQIRATELFQ